MHQSLDSGKIRRNIAAALEGGTVTHHKEDR